jgi:hypothetical protein
MMSLRVSTAPAVSSVPIRATKKPSVFTEGWKSDRAAYFFELRLNFEVNFSTRPAVSTRRFSPV